MTVYGVFRGEMIGGMYVEMLEDLCAYKDEAEVIAKELNADNTNPMESDSYGPLRGCEYLVKALEVRC